MTRLDTRSYPRAHISISSIGWAEYDLVSDVAFDKGCRQLLGVILDSTRWYDGRALGLEDRYRMITNVYPADVWGAYTIYEQSILFGELYQHD